MTIKPCLPDSLYIAVDGDGDTLGTAKNWPDAVALHRQCCSSWSYHAVILLRAKDGVLSGSMDVTQALEECCDAKFD